MCVLEHSSEIFWGEAGALVVTCEDEEMEEVDAVDNNGVCWDSEGWDEWWFFLKYHWSFAFEISRWAERSKSSLNSSFKAEYEMHGSKTG